MNKKYIFIGGIFFGIIFLALSVYYFTPGHYHYFVSKDPNSYHITHGVGFLILSAISFLASLVNRSKIKG